MANRHLRWGATICLLGYIWIVVGHSYGWPNFRLRIFSANIFINCALWVDRYRVAGLYRMVWK
ncbi:MAG: hypothetical protein HC767_13580, partial [Akkermansiaceae bacterium]|nr:hypothetical protein [Akkermansiaceae bacterium]